MKVSSTKPPRELLPGFPKAIINGCTCEAEQEPTYHRDGWGWDIDSNCPLHSHWGELAE